MRSTPGRSTSPRPCSCSAAPISDRSPAEPVDLSLIAEEASETLLPLAEKHGVTIETSGDITPTIGSHALLLQLTTNLVHNAIVHNLPEHGTVQVTTAIRPEAVTLTVENTGDTLAPQLVSTLTEPFQRGIRTHPRRPCGRRPRPGHRQEHHQGARRHPHDRPPPGRRDPRHDDAAGRPAPDRPLRRVALVPARTWTGHAGRARAMCLQRPSHAAIARPHRGSVEGGRTPQPRTSTGGDEAVP